MDTGTVLAVGLAALIAVLVRAAMTLADISRSLEELASRGGKAPAPELVAPLAAPALGSGRAAAPGAELALGAGAIGAEPGEDEIVAVIAVAREALAGALPLAR